MKRHRFSTLSATTCLLSVGCVSTGDLDERIAQVQRESLRTIWVLECRIAELHAQLNEARVLALEAIQKEALVRGAETLDLREQVGETERYLMRELAFESLERAGEYRTLSNEVATAKRDLSARIDVEAMARVEEQRQLLRKTEDVGRAIAAARQEERDQVTEAIAELDRDMAERIGNEQNARELALALLGDEMRDLHRQSNASVADSLRAIEDAEAGLYAELAQTRSSLLAEISGEWEARIVQTEAIAELIERRYATSATKLNELGSRLEALREHFDASHLARHSRREKAHVADATPPVPLATVTDAPAEAVGP